MKNFEDDKVRKLMYEDDLLVLDGFVEKHNVKEFQSSEYIEDLHLLIFGEANNPRDRVRNAMIVVQSILTQKIRRKPFCIPFILALFL